MVFTFRFWCNNVVVSTRDAISVVKKCDSLPTLDSGLNSRNNKLINETAIFKEFIKWSLQHEKSASKSLGRSEITEIISGIEKSASF